MERRRLLFLGLGVTLLLAVAAVASSGRPLSTSQGTGPSASFFDYVFTTIVIVSIAMTLIVAYVVAIQPRGAFRRPRRRWHLLSTLLGILIVGFAVAILLHSGLAQRLQALHLLGKKQAQVSHGLRGAKAGENARNARLRWDEVAVVFVLVAGVAVLLLASRGAKHAPRPWRLRSQEAVSLALDESLDDLRNEPDLRRAIIAAYSRMERALAAGGVPRRPAEAPFEYVERALQELDAGAEGVRRLTDLFEWAKFSHHDPEPEMRDEAIDALVAVRDELRRPAEAAVA